jgi:hypothetical protein
MNVKQILVAGLLGALMAGSASANLVTNGSFENITFQGTASLATIGSIGGVDAYTLTYGGAFASYPGEATVLQGWTSTAIFAFVAEPPTTGTFSAENDYNLWPGSTDTVPITSPDGGNFIIDDSTQQYTGYLSQTVNGLRVGDTYTLSFYQAGSQQQGFYGDTIQQWDVSFGSSTFDSALMTVPSQGFSPWEQQTTTFVATSTSEVLSFLGESNVNGGQPPFILLDGVSLTDTTAPEPGSFWLIGFGSIAFFSVRKLRRARS